MTVYGALHCGGALIVGVSMTATWHYKTTTSSCAGVSGPTGTASWSRGIGSATSGYYVAIDVCFAHEGQQFCGQTGFTPQ